MKGAYIWTCRRRRPSVVRVWFYDPRKISQSAIDRLLRAHDGALVECIDPSHMQCIAFSHGDYLLSWGLLARNGVYTRL